MFTIPITKDDGYGEGAETFTLTISAGTGYTVGTQGTATVTILDSPPGRHLASPADGAELRRRNPWLH